MLPLLLLLLVGDVRVVRDIVNLKEKYPSRVHIILGNRDINKMRLTVELSNKALRSPPDVYWNRDVNVNQTNQKPADRLKWILLRTMGAPIAFESRREELIDLGKSACDDDVLKSFLEFVKPKDGKPEGILTKYLKYGQIVHRVKNILFVHGAIHGYNIGWVPPYDGKESQVATNLDDWIRKINEFARHESQDYAERTNEYVGMYQLSLTDKYWSSNAGYYHNQPGSRLVQYGMGWLADKTRNPSVIYATYSTETNQPEPQVSEWLTSNGIRTLVVGHQPRGDAPMLLDNNGLQIVSGDTSYAKNALWDKDGTGTWASIASSKAESELNYPASSTRADVVSEVLIDIDETGNSVVSVHGVLSDGGKYEYILPKSSSNQYLGKSTSTGWIVKASNVRYSSDPESSYYLLSQVSGFDTKNRLVPHDNINLEF